MYIGDNEDLMREWDWDKNKALGLDPYKLKQHSNKKVWWICSKCGHNYSKIISERTNGGGCPVCAGKVVVQGVNDLATTHPHLVREWHPTKNGNLTPFTISFGTHKKIWWKCDKGHEWEALVSNRARLGRGCPYCVGQKVLQGENDLATTHPHLVAEWHPTKNGDLTPHQVMAGTHKKVWWKCGKGHEWEAEIKSRSSGTGCPICSKKKLLVGYNDLATTCPEIAKKWHPTKNGLLTPKDVTKSSMKKVWWICDNGHEFLATVSSRQKRGCPQCAANMRTSFPEQAIFYYISKVFPDAINGYKDIFEKSMELDIYIPSIRVGIEYDGGAYHNHQSNLERDMRKYRICQQHGIVLIRVRQSPEFLLVPTFDYRIDIMSQKYTDIDRAVNYILNILGVKFDVNVKRDRSHIQEYLQMRKKSLFTEYPEIAREWNAEKNGKLTPKMFAPQSNEKVWWKCAVCGHEWITSIGERTGRDKTGCPKCARKRGGVKRHESNLLLKGSICDTHPFLISEWNFEKNVDIRPEDVTAGSGKKVWWICRKCHYEWETSVGARTRGRGCPACANQVLIKGHNDLASNAPWLIPEWHKEKNEKGPDEVFAHSGKKVWWYCSICGYEWSATIGSRTAGAGCPACANKKKRTGRENS